MGRIREIKNVFQNEENVHKRWFTDDDYWDLYVWTDNEDEIIGIQLCYNKEIDERALTWFKSGKFTHLQVNPGYLYGNRSGSPILMPDGAFDNNNILKRFKADSIDLDVEIVNLVIDKIIKFKNKDT